MKLRRLKADGFGLLRGEYVFDPDRVTVVIDDNERGKSSLLSALAAGLYGLDADARHYRGLMTPLERWRPWDGGSYRVELELESGGARYWVIRDFTQGTVAVWNERGQDVTEQFRAGRDEYPVGLVLLGLDVDEFAKCAFWRQGELEDVVPDLEKDRRGSTLRARLEQAADTRAGDTSAAEALQALRAGVERFHSPVLGTTIKIENALARLEGTRDALETEIGALEHDYRAAAAPLEELAGLTEEERTVRGRLARGEARLTRLRASDARQRLERDDERRAEFARLRAEASSLAPAAGVPEDAEPRLRDSAARHEVVQRGLEAPQPPAPRRWAIVRG